MDRLRPDPQTFTRRRLLGGLTAAAGWLAGAAQAEDGGRYSLGIVPYLPARRLISYYSALLPALTGALRRPVEISSAPNYLEHLGRLRRRSYDLVADSLFIARIAQRELGHVPLVRTAARLEPVLVTPLQGGIDQLAALQGQSICVTDRIAALSVIGLRYLRDHDLEPGRRVRIVVSGSHANSLHRMLAGDAVAAIVSRTTLHQVEPELAQRVRVLQVLPSALSAVVYHVAPRHAAQAGQLTRALLDFGRSAEGQRFVEALGHQGLLPVQQGEMEQLDPMVVEFYRQLALAE
ncbi:MAG: hypothetical protein RJA44_530 [Pseudomonadota bacterium]|jgi:ABC-type phosphate/phosphonate transport system substrate-binding protein